MLDWMTDEENMTSLVYREGGITLTDFGDPKPPNKETPLIRNAWAKQIQIEMQKAYIPNYATSLVHRKTCATNHGHPKGP